MDMKTITATEANRRFAEILNEAAKGQTFLVTSHGKPAITIAPAAHDIARQRLAHKRLMEHLRSQTPVNAGKWSRDELYESED